MTIQRSVWRGLATSLSLTVMLTAPAAVADTTGKQAPLPNSLFSDHAVLQQGARIPVWGTAPSGERVTVEFADHKVSTVATNGKWRTELPPLPASAEPRTMTITGSDGDVRRIDDVLVGEVWVASGQSNMERQLGPRKGQKELTGWKEEAASANYPLVRQFYVPQQAASLPVPDVMGAWSVCTPGSAPDFTAVGYYFARDLHKALKTPVGIIHASYGGTDAEAWTPEASLAAMPGYEAALASLASAQKSETNASTPLAQAQPLPRTSHIGKNSASALYNAMINPLQPFPVAGVIWYQGENNAGRANRYADLFSTMAAGWRGAWGLGCFPFLYVQVAPFRNMPPEIREAQRAALAKIPRAAMVVTIDLGDVNDIHPTRKEPVGQRLALAARALAYGGKLEYSGPLPTRATARGGSLTVHFEHTGSGLEFRDGKGRGFEVAGTNGVFAPAEARIEGEDVVLNTPAAGNAVAVRYGWANVPDVNLFNREGLPATPFQMTTTVPSKSGDSVHADPTQHQLH